MSLDDMWRRERPGPATVVPGADKGRAGQFCPEDHYSYGCTRIAGHPGRHMASVGGDRIVGAWPGTHRPTVADLGGES